MDFKEFKKSYKEIVKSIYGLDNVRDNTATINDARRAIKANVDKIKSNEEIINNTENTIAGWDKTRKQSEFESFLEEQNVSIRNAESAIKQARSDIDELQRLIDDMNNEDKTNKERTAEKKAQMEVYKSNVRKNAESQYNQELGSKEKEYETLKAQKNIEKTELGRKYSAIITSFSERTSGNRNLTKEEAAVLKRIKEEEKAIDKKYLGLLKEKNNQILKLKEGYKDLIESFDKIDKNPNIENKAIGLEEEQKPVEKKPTEEKPAEEKPEGEKAEGEKAEGEKPEGEKAEGEQTEGEQAEGEQAEGEKAEGEQAEEEKPEEEFENLQDLFQRLQEESSHGGDEQSTLPKGRIQSIDVKGNNYIFKVKYGDNIVTLDPIQKKSLRDRITAIRTLRKEYGITFLKSFRINPTIFNTIIDRENNISREDLINYLKYPKMNDDESAERRGYSIIKEKRPNRFLNWIGNKLLPEGKEVTISKAEQKTTNTAHMVERVNVDERKAQEEAKRREDVRQIVYGIDGNGDNIVHPEDGEEK